jgi:energy-coupling factor transporter ATP-binding protein EcfA2
MLEVCDIDVFYGDAQALDRVSIDVEEGKIVAIVGANGAGKTSLIRTIAGMQRPARGRITFRGADITGWPSHRVCNAGIGQVAEGRQVFATLTASKSPPCCGGPAASAPRASRGCLRCFRFSANASARRLGRCQAGSSRCLLSAAA